MMKLWNAKCVGNLKSRVKSKCWTLTCLYVDDETRDARVVFRKCFQKGELEIYFERCFREKKWNKEVWGCNGLISGAGIAWASLHQFTCGITYYSVMISKFIWHWARILHILHAKSYLDITPSLPILRFIGEESVAGGAKIEWTDSPTWIIDPIDGTTNFVHRYTLLIFDLSYF